MTVEDLRPAELLEVLRTQLVANEQLVLAAVRAHEEIDRVVERQLVTEREASDLRDRQKALQTAATFRERLLRIVGTDLRAPLEKIVDSAQLMTLRGGLRPCDVALASQIVTVGTELTRLVTQLADYTRGRAASGFSLDVSTLDYGALCEQIASQIRVPGSVVIHFSQSGNVVGSGDSSRLGDALASMVNHAVQCTAPASPVLMHCSAAGDRIVVQVSNRGPCIPPDHLALVVAAFHRGELDGDEGLAHLGLGLVIASQVAAAHGGRIDVQSAEGMTTFTLDVPREYVAPARQSAVG